MNLDKSTKRIAKRVKRGFQGYPQISISYFGKTPESASEVVIGYIAQENASVQEQRFSCDSDARTDETLQTTILKVIERADAKTVIEDRAVTITQ